MAGRFSVKEYPDLMKSAVENKRTIEAKEEQRRLKIEAEKNDIFDKHEREKIEQQKRAKAARIQYHLEEIERQRLKEAVIAEEKAVDVKSRLKNVDVTFEQNRVFALTTTEKTNKHKKSLLDQMEDRYNRDKQERNTIAELNYMKAQTAKENRHFMNYANELIGDAKTKNRPVLPLLKAVENYKYENYHDFNERKPTPRHLKTRIPIDKSASRTRSLKYEMNELKSLNPCNQEKENSKNDQKYKN